MRAIQGGGANNGGGAQYLGGQNSQDMSEDSFHLPNSGRHIGNGPQNSKHSNSVGMPQQRRLLETSNMFSVYRNSLKVGDQFMQEGNSTMPKQTSHHSHNHKADNMYATARHGGGQNGFQGNAEQHNHFKGGPAANKLIM